MSLMGGKKLRDLAKVRHRMKYYETTKNYSGTAYTLALRAWARSRPSDPFVMSSALASYGARRARQAHDLEPLSRLAPENPATGKDGEGLNRARWDVHVNGLRTILLPDPELRAAGVSPGLRELDRSG